MIVMKFGGTSLGLPDRIRSVAGIVSEARSARPVVVLSAIGGVTDKLIETGAQASQGQSAEVTDGLLAIREIHDRTAHELIPAPDRRRALESELGPVWEEINNVFTGVLLLREVSPRSKDLIASFGERLIVPMFAAFLSQEGIEAKAVDARQLIVTKEEADFALVDFAETKHRCQQLKVIAESGQVPVVAGFVCATPEGITTTLGRGGSDYSASVVGFAIDADQIQIWTDVDGVMTADPRIVPDAQVLPRISYKEAAEMSYFGAKVLHPKTIMPAADVRIPILIKNTFHPARAGTLISEDSPENHQGVKTVASITGVTLVSIEGRGMIGVPGTAQRVFGAIARKNINVLMFSQGSSEQHISMVVNRADGDSTVRALRREFGPEIEKRQVDQIASVADIAIIALVGEGMKSIPGVAARTFGVLGEPATNILMIAQGSSELNLSFVVRREEASAAVRLIHQAFDLGV